MNKIKLTLSNFGNYEDRIISNVVDIIPWRPATIIITYRVTDNEEVEELIPHVMKIEVVA